MASAPVSALQPVTTETKHKTRNCTNITCRTPPRQMGMDEEDRGASDCNYKAKQRKPSNFSWPDNASQELLQLRFVTMKPKFQNARNPFHVKYVWSCLA